MTSTPKFQPVQLSVEDAGEILTLQRAAYVSEAILYGDVRLAPLTQTLAELKTELLDRRVIAVGIHDDARLVGAMRLRVDGNRAFLGRLVVAPDLQGRGLGTLLLSEVDRFLPRNVEAVELFTGDRSVQNIHLYERMGYTEYRREDAGDFALVFLERTVGRDFTA